LTPTATAFYGPECERSLALWQDLRYRYHVSPTPAELGVMGQNVGFLTGRIAMMSQGPWVMPFFNDTKAPYGLLHTPRGPDGRRATRITWDAVVLFSGSKKKDLAWRFIHHLVSERCQQILATFQRSIPARKSTCDAFIRANPKVEAGKFVQAAGEYARKQPITEHWELMYSLWLDLADGLRDPRRAARLTPAEAIGRFYSRIDRNHTELHQRLPPADKAQAERYVQIYEARKKPRRESRP
jgi:ABC-type glycerol-3-phosphate transport system substrate-binding protein